MDSRPLSPGPVFSPPRAFRPAQPRGPWTHVATVATMSPPNAPHRVVRSVVASHVDLPPLCPTRWLPPATLHALLRGAFCVTTGLVDRVTRYSEASGPRYALQQSWRTALRVTVGLVGRVTRYTKKWCNAAWGRSNRSSRCSTMRVDPAMLYDAGGPCGRYESRAGL